MKTDDKEHGTYDKVVITTMLMTMNIGVFCLGMWMIVYVFPDFKAAIDNRARHCKKRCCHCCCNSYNIGEKREPADETQHCKWRTNRAVDRGEWLLRRAWKNARIPKTVGRPAQLVPRENGGNGGLCGRSKREMAY